MSDITASRSDLPAEMDPRGWDLSDQSTSCSMQVPIHDAFDSLNSCYKSGGDLAACSQSSGYKDTFAKYQTCLAGDSLADDQVACDSDPDSSTGRSSNGTWQDDLTPSIPSPSLRTTTSSQSPSQGASVGKWIPMPIESLIAFICGLMNTVMLVVVVYFVMKYRAR